MPDPPFAPPAAETLEWPSITHRFAVEGHKGYLTVVLDEDERPFLLEIRMAKAGGVLRGLLDALAVSVSLGLQRGIPLADYVEQLSLTRFEPAGWTRHSEIRYAHSIVDYLFRWLGLRFPRAAPLEAPRTAFEGETCSVCRCPVTWELGTPCPECGHVDQPAGSPLAATGDPG